MVVPKLYEVTFLPLSETKKRKNVKCPWSLDKLYKKWVKGVEVIYFGCAGDRENLKTDRSLRKRLTDLINHANGRTTERGPHKGGEIIWQLKGYETFEVGYLPTEEPPEPRNLEKWLNCTFKSLKGGRLPFGNRRI